MQYANEINRIQDAMLHAITLYHDEVIKIFSANSHNESNVDITLKQLFHYFGDRTQAVAHLVSCELPWDAEIILRCFLETAAKIWFICLASEDEQKTLIDEFWGISAQIHNRKKAGKAHFSKELFLHANSLDNVNIFEMLEDKTEFERDALNKKERKIIEQKWSFTEIVTHLEKNHPPSFPMKYVSSFLFGYDTASHLIHVDDCALDLMQDRALREANELEILQIAHYTRIWSDLVGLWFISLEALHYKYNIPRGSKELFRVYEGFGKLCEPIQERFNNSQREFYDDWKKRRNPSDKLNTNRQG